MKEFSPEQKKEYQTVVLAALLHDIGKFLHRMTGVAEFKGVHQHLGADLVSGKDKFSPTGEHSKLYPFSQMIRTEWVDKDELEMCIRKHHQGGGNLAWIVHKADSYSTKERFRAGEGVTSYPPKGPMIALRPVFASVFPAKETPVLPFAYKASKLDSFKSFPVEKKEKLNEDETSFLFEEFIEDELLNINLEKATFEKFYNTLHSIFEKYLWCLPCHTHPAIADVSIFDHLKSSSAIAACLYHYHLANGNLKPMAIKNDDEKKFLLVGGDLSGIQNYIYQISAIAGEGGVAKRLRARSFFISALMEVIILKILQELDLPVSCNLISAGGKFIILAPNTQEVKVQLHDLYKEISQWLLEKFSGELCLIMDWTTQIQGNDFYRKKEKAPAKDTPSEDEDGDEDGEEPDEEEMPHAPRECDFRDRLDALYHALESAKLAKFKIVLSKAGAWHEDKFKRSRMYQAYGEVKGISDCHVCKKFPALYADPHDIVTSEKVLCVQCAIDKVIGRKLLDARYLAIGKDINKRRRKEQDAASMKERDSFFFFKDDYFIKLLEGNLNLKNTLWEPDFILLQRLRDHRDEKEAVDVGAVHRFMANYTPFFEKGLPFFEKGLPDARLCNVCREDRPCDQIEIMKKSTIKKHLYTFNCIAAASSEIIAEPESNSCLDAASSETVAESESYRGNQLIGILKADVDNLGLIFSEGLGNKVTISRYLTMSRMLDLFFSGWMYRILNDMNDTKDSKDSKDTKDTAEYREIYTVYSGGDDLVLVGPWEKIINFAQRLNQEFRRFTCGNEKITLSAGIAIVKPKHPISAAVALADKYLDMSKAAGKNRLTLFDTTVKWAELDSILTYGKTLNEGHRRFSKILTTGFIYRLLTYQNMYLDSKTGNIGELVFHSRMHYDVRRNLTERIANLSDEQEKEWFEAEIQHLMLKLYKTPVDKVLMDNLKIPVYWTLYKNREYTIRGEEP